MFTIMITQASFYIIKKGIESILLGEWLHLSLLKNVKSDSNVMFQADTVTMTIVG